MDRENIEKLRAVIGRVKVLESYLNEIIEELSLIYSREEEKDRLLGIEAQVEEFEK